jgi:stage II sporulation protein D
MVIARNRTYLGVVEATAATGPFRLVDQVDVEQYLKGMGEVLDPSWPQAALRAQAIVARTYALRAMNTAGELCDDQRCQVYLGAQAEYPAMDQAVDATNGQVVVAGGTYAATVYSANGGAFSASRAEGFGTDGGDYPYLRAAPYPTGDPLPWEVQVALSDVASRLGYQGELSSVRVTRTGPSLRALEVTLVGSTGSAIASGLSFASALGLRSTLFAVSTATAATAPPPPPPSSGGFLQVLPDQVGTLAPAGAAAPGAASSPVVDQTGTLGGGPGAPERAAEKMRRHGGPLTRRGVPGWATTLALLLLGGVTAGSVLSARRISARRITARRLSGGAL